MLGRACSLVLLVLAASGPWSSTASAATYHVSPAGSDSASGLTALDAWRTIAKANAEARPGDRVYVWPNPDGYAHFPHPDSAGSNPTGGGRIAFIGASNAGDPLVDLAARAGIVVPQGDLVTSYTSMSGLTVRGSCFVRSPAQRCSVSACTIEGDLALDGCRYSVVSRCVSYGPRLSIAYVGNRGAVVGCTVEDCSFPLLGVGVAGGNHRFITGATETAKCDSLRFLRNRLIITISDNMDSHPRVHFWTQHSLFAHNYYRIYTKNRTRETYALRLRDSTLFNAFVCDTIVMTGSAPAIVYFSSDGDSLGKWKKTVGNITMDSCYVNLIGSTGGSRMLFQQGMYGWTLRYNTMICAGRILDADDVKQRTIIDHNTFVGGPNLGIVSFDKSPIAPAFNDTVTFTNNILYSLVPGIPNDLVTNNCPIYIHSQAFDSAGAGLLVSDHNLYAYYGYRTVPGDRTQRWDQGQYSRTGAGGTWSQFFGQDEHSIYGSPLFMDSTISSGFNAYLSANSPALHAGSELSDIGAVTHVGVLAAPGDAPPPAPRLALGASPNPARGGVTLSFELPRAGPAAVRVFDLAGRTAHAVAMPRAEAGAHVLRWDGLDARGQRVPPGIYFIELSAAGERRMRRVAMLR